MRRLTAVLCVALAACLQGVFTFSTLLPDFLTLWSLSATDAGWISGIYYGAYVIAVVVLVSLTDRVDARRVFLFGAALSALGSFGFAVLADGFWSAMALRTVGGIGLAGVYMPGAKMLGDRLAGATLSRATSYYTSSFGIGTAASFLFAGLIAEWLDWRWAFAAAGVTASAGFLMVAFLVPARAAPAQPAASGSLFNFRPVLRNRPTMAYVVCYAAHNYELFAYRSWIVAFLVFAQGLQPSGSALWDAAVAVTVISLLGMPCSVAGNELSLRFGRPRVVAAVMIASAVAAAGMGFLAPLPMLAVVAAAAGYYALIIGESAAVTAGALLSAPEDLRGVTMAVYSGLGFVGAFLGPIGFGVALDAAGGAGDVVAWGVAFAASGIVLLAGPAAIRLLMPRQPPLRDSAP